MKRYIPLFVLLRLCYGGDGIDVQDLVRRAGSTMQSDWAAAPGFAFIQRDLTTSKGVTTRKTHQVFSISGSDYYMPIAIDDEPLSADQQERELQRLKEEVVRRSHETTQQARRRSEQYSKAREQNGVLLLEFTKAFDFTLMGEEMTNGRATYVLYAMPRPGYEPPNRTAKILTGMARPFVDRQREFPLDQRRGRSTEVRFDLWISCKGATGDEDGAGNDSCDRVRLAGKPLRCRYEIIDVLAKVHEDNGI